MDISSRLARLCERVVLARPNGSRGRFPESVRREVIELLDEGVSAEQISEVTKITQQTILYWRDRVQAKQSKATQMEFSELTVRSQAEPLRVWIERKGWELLVENLTTEELAHLLAKLLP